MQITLKQLEIFNAVVLSGNISKACGPLSLAQPTISQQLAKMEDALGAQLIRRERTKAVELTLAGEFWFKTAKDVLKIMKDAKSTHTYNFGKMKLALRFGTTPTLRGHFLQEVSEIAIDLEEFSNVEFVWALTSNQVIEMMNNHLINFGVVSEASAEPFRSSLYIQKLFDDPVVWVVPRNIPERVIELTLKSKTKVEGEYDAINRYVDVHSGIPWHNFSLNWFRSELPHSIPFFSCMTHQAAIDIVAGGKATCHAPVSLLPNLPTEVLNKVKCYRANIYLRRAVLVMPKHLMTLRPFSEMADRISNFFFESYLDKVSLEELPGSNVQDVTRYFAQKSK